MQAPPSHTASGEILLSVLPPSISPAPGSRTPHSPTGIFFPESGKSRGASRASVCGGVAEGIGLAHDVGNLLGAMRLYCDLLALPGVLGGEHRHYAEELRRLTARSGSLIARLLRPDQPAMEEGDAERIHLAEVVLECRGMLATIAGPESLRIAVDADANAEAAVPREALERILVNLTKNAVEAGWGGADAKKGRELIAIRVRSVAEWGARREAGIALTVEDRGRGMEESALRAALAGHADSPQSGAKARPGRGVGLRIVRELVAGTGGELRMRSRAGHGTTVEIVWAALPGERPGSG